MHLKFRYKNETFSFLNGTQREFEFFEINSNLFVTEPQYTESWRTPNEEARPRIQDTTSTTAALHCTKVLVFDLLVKVIIFLSSQCVMIGSNVTLESNRNK